MLPVIITAAIAVGAFALLSRWIRRRPDSAGLGQTDGFDQEDFPADPVEQPERDYSYPEPELDPWEKYDQLRDAEERRNTQAVRDILQGDDQEVARLLMELARQHGSTPQEAARDDDLIRQIARSIDDDMRNVLSFASRTNAQTDSIELEPSDELRPTAYPSDEFSVGPMVSDADVDAIVPEDLALTDDVFYPLFGEDELQVTRHFERLQKRRRVYILLDISGSMEGHMQSGRGTRIQWAAGVALKLMLKARAGQAEYLLRFFGDTAHERQQVSTPEEAQVMIDTLIRLRDWNEGTDIEDALRTAVDDITSADDEIETSDILLISDGEASLDQAWLHDTFGEDIRLHVAMIGLDNPVLADQTISTSYEVYK